MINVDNPSSASAKKHSRFGIISTIIGIGIPALSCFMFFFPFMNPNISNEDYFALTLCLPTPLWLGGLILAIIGLIQKNYKKLYSILGMILLVLDVIPIMLIAFFALFGGGNY